MQRRNITDLIKNAVGTVFLLAGAFFVCSTLVSMRAVFADPVAPAITATSTATASPRATNSRNTAASRGTGATTASRPSMANRTTNVTSRNTQSRGVAARTATSRGTATTGTTAASRAGSSAASRSVGARGTATRTGTATNTATQSRGVAARTGTTARVSANNSARTVAARTSSSAASRVSLQGSAIRGISNSSFSKYYTGNYSNIIDSSTGLISAEAYNNCMESYYACMDEICTARNQAQRRCACAGRVKAFATAEAQLETANEELIKVAGELTLLEATKGKDISAALQLTDAEKVLNCVSWQEVTNEYGQNSEEAIDWCVSHGIYASSGGRPVSCGKPTYCTSGGNDFGFDVSSLTGGGSDILASLQSFISAKENTMTILNNDDEKVTNAFSELNTIISNNLSGLNTTLSTDLDLKDSLANTWGYELFEYAHNNVCNRVLDSCFNGIYEACGQPTGSSKKQRKCGNGQTQCPYNYSSYISVDKSNGEYTLDFISENTSYSHSVSNSATCFGYTTSDGDPYNTLRGPVADARRSIMQKYALDANADCDVYGEQLRAQAQNISYQKVAAQQALQKKRLEYAQDEEKENETALANAKQNYLNCLDEIQQCRNDIENMYYKQGWSKTRIKSYCNTMSNVPHCYETMVCDNSATRVVTESDALNDSTRKLVQNVVTLSEILAMADTGDTLSRAACLNGDMNVKEIRSYGLNAETRETCIPTNGVKGYREYKDNDWTDCSAEVCQTGYEKKANSKGIVECVVPDGMVDDANVTKTGPFSPIVGFRCQKDYIASGTKCVPANCAANAEYDTSCLIPSAEGTPNGCVSVGCKCSTQTVVNSGTCGTCSGNNHLEGTICKSNTRDCDNDAKTGKGTQTYSGSTWGSCVLSSCISGYHLTSDKQCISNVDQCPMTGALYAEKTWNGTDWGDCIAKTCDTSANYILENNTCKRCNDDQYVKNNKCVDQKEW